MLIMCYFFKLNDSIEELLWKNYRITNFPRKFLNLNDMMISLLLLLVVFILLYILYTSITYYIATYAANKLVIGIRFTKRLLYSRHLGRNFIYIESDILGSNLGSTTSFLCDSGQMS